MIENNFIVIKGWMVTALNLKGNELLIYALIYGFNQDGFTKFSGSVKYIQKWTNCTKKTVITTLSRLTEKGLIEKESSIENGNKVCQYTCKDITYLGGVKITPRGVKITPGGGVKITPNNIIDNNIVKSNKNTVQEIREKENVTLFRERCFLEFEKHFTRGWTSKSQIKIFDELRVKVYDRVLKKSRDRGIEDFWLNKSKQKIDNIILSICDTGFKIAANDNFWKDKSARSIVRNFDTFLDKHKTQTHNTRTKRNTDA